MLSGERVLSILGMLRMKNSEHSTQTVEGLHILQARRVPAALGPTLFQSAVSPVACGFWHCRAVPAMQDIPQMSSLPGIC